MKDRDLRDRHGAAKIHSSQVNVICVMWDSGQYIQKEIRNMFGINPRTVSSIIRGTHWKHVKRIPLK